MTWALAEAAQLFAASYSVRASLKRLKRLASAVDDAAVSSLEEVLMFWVIFGVYMVFEKHLEFLVRWVPGFYYLKASFIVVVAFPRLNFTKMVFHKGIVPFLETCNRRLTDAEADWPSLQTFLLNLPFLLAGLAFPFLVAGGAADVFDDDVVVADAVAAAAAVDAVVPPPTPPPLPPRVDRGKCSPARDLPPPRSPLSPSAVGLPAALQNRLRESGRRLSSLAAMMNRSRTPSPVKSLPLLPPHVRTTSSNSNSNGAGGGVEDKENSAVKRSGSRGPGGLSNSTQSSRFGAATAASTPSPARLSPSLPPLPPLSPTSGSGLMSSLKSLFSLDPHSPPCNSIDRHQRRKTLMALQHAGLGGGSGGGARETTERKPRTPPAAMPSYLGAGGIAGRSSSRTSPSPGPAPRPSPSPSPSSSPSPRKSSLPPLEEALMSGNVSLGRAGRRR